MAATMLGVTQANVSPEQVLTLRLAAQGVSKPGRSPIGAFTGWAVQDSPPGAATTAALARTVEVDAGWLDEALAQDRSLVSLYNARTATAIVPAPEVAEFATALRPECDVALKAVLGRAVPEQSSDFQEPVDLAVEAISDALDGAALSRDALHEELRQRLPDALLPWCEGCQSHHARRGLLVMASLRGRLCISGREGRQPVFSRTDQWIDWNPPAPATARAMLARRYVSWFGPTTPAHLADWTGLTKTHAQELWATIEDDLVEVNVDGIGKAWLLAEDLAALKNPSPADGVRLIGPGDPLLQAKDREIVLPNVAARKEVWTAIPTTGIVLAGGAAGTWKAKKSGKRLAITVTALTKLSAATRAQIQAEAERLAPHRGCASASISWT